MPICFATGVVVVLGGVSVGTNTGASVSDGVGGVIGVGRGVVQI